jgi:hypothetical protein|eukprot:COSAG02_NODE_193_length_29843_cov_30.519903_11_plen_163_part_00
MEHHIPARASHLHSDDGRTHRCRLVPMNGSCLVCVARISAIWRSSSLTVRALRTAVNRTMAKQQELLERVLDMQLLSRPHQTQRDSSYHFSSPAGMEQTMSSAGRASMSPSLRDVRQGAMFGSKGHQHAVRHSSSSSSDEELRNEAVGEGRRRVPPHWIGRG